MMAILLLLAAGPAAGGEGSRAEPASTGRPTDDREPADAPKGRPRLRLGALAYPTRPSPPPPPSDLPRFDTHVDVEGWTRPDPNQTMAVFWLRWKMDTAIYGRGMAVQDGKRGVNVLPLVELGLKKWRDREEKSPPLDLGEVEKDSSP